MAKIKNLNDLREHALDALEKLAMGSLTIEEAGATSKLCENVVSTLKLELDLAKLVGKEPTIDFIADHSQWVSIPKRKNMEIQNENDSRLLEHK